MDNLTINVGAFHSEQETKELTLQYNTISVTDANNFVKNIIRTDDQLNNIWLNGGIYGVAMQDSVKKIFSLTQEVDTDAFPGTWILPATTDDLKLFE